MALMVISILLAIVCFAMQAYVEHRHLLPKKVKKPKMTMTHHTRMLNEETDRLKAELDRTRADREYEKARQVLLDFGVHPDAIITAEDVKMPEVQESEPAPEQAPFVKVLPDTSGYSKRSALIENLAREERRLTRIQEMQRRASWSMMDEWDAAMVTAVRNVRNLRDQLDKLEAEAERLKAKEDFTCEHGPRLYVQAKSHTVPNPAWAYVCQAGVCAAIWTPREGVPAVTPQGQKLELWAPAEPKKKDRRASSH